MKTPLPLCHFEPARVRNLKTELSKDNICPDEI